MVELIRGLALALGLAPLWANPVKGVVPVAPQTAPSGSAGAVPQAAPAATLPAAPALIAPAGLAPLGNVPLGAVASPLAPVLQAPAAKAEVGALALPTAAAAGPLAESRGPRSTAERRATPAPAAPEAQARPEHGAESSALDAGRPFDGTAPAGEDFERLLEESLAGWEQGKTAGEPADILEAERPVVSPSDVARMRRTESMLVAAVEKAAQKTFGRRLTAVSRGSSARLTNDKPDPDYDLMVELPADVAAEKDPLHGDLRDFRAALATALEEDAGALVPRAVAEVSVGYPRALTSASSRKLEDGVLMVPVRITFGGPGAAHAVDADVALTTRKTFANAYPEHFRAQLAEVHARSGKAGADRVLSDIRLAKRFFREAVGAYKFYQGGPTGVGVEQIVLQAGSFDAMIDRLHGAYFDPQGRPRGAKKARQAWVVPNPFMEPANFLALLSDGAWARVGHAARAYRQAKAVGRPITLESLEYRKPAPPPAHPKPSGPKVSFQPDPKGERVIVLRAGASKRASRDELDRFLKRLSRRLELRGRPQPAGTNRDLRIGLPLAAGADASRQLDVITRYFQRAGGLRLLEIEVPEAPAPRAPTEMTREAVPRSGMRAGRGERRTAAPAPRAPTEMMRAGRGERRTAAPAPEAAAPAAAAQAKGATLEFLERFTLTGPKPAERGEAYLLAQGAKALPAGLEAAWAARRPSPAPARGETSRVVLLRRDGEAVVRMETFDRFGATRVLFLKVPPHLAAGVASESVVEVTHEGERVTGLRVVGGYPVDMIIGRVRSRDGRLFLEGLFRHGDRRASVYPPVPISGVPDGSIVQAFVKPSGDAWEAVPLADLGRKITPEIAARELAFQHGARGYFESSVIDQAETAASEYDVSKALERLKERAARAGRRVEDLRKLPFITIDPVGAGDLDDAYYTERHDDGSWTWYLATADVGQFVKPGTPAFRAAARIGNTFYSIDKDGVGEYPMNHPLVSKYAASLLAGKDSLAMITKMRFGPDGRFMLSESDVFVGAIRVQGRYTYDQVHELWQGRPGHGIEHLEQVQLTRRLASALQREDDRRGKLDFDIPELRHSKGPGGWTTEAVVEPELLREAHRLIEELKVYGNRVIGTRLMELSRKHQIPHVSRVHQAQEERINDRVKEELASIGVPWKDGPLAEYLARLRAREDLSPEVKETAQLLVLISRKPARYAVDDVSEHEGLALEGGAYDHPSTPIRRFSDMYNRAMLQAYLEGEDPKSVHDAVLADLRSLGFKDFDEYLEHLNGRAFAARRMDLELDEFMAVHELAKPENRGRTFRGYVKLLKRGRDATAVIALKGSPATITLRGEAAKAYELLDEVAVEVRGADVESLAVDAKVRKLGPRR